MGVIRRHDERLLEVPGADIRLVASVVGVRSTRHHGGLAVLHAGPREVEVRAHDGRRHTARVRDLDWTARCAIVLVGAVAVIAGRRGRRRSR